MIRSWLIVFVGALTTATLSGVQAGEDPLRVEGGLLSGTRGTDPSIRLFKGIPFAAPPVGSRRWMPPQPVNRWNGVRKADAFSAMCIQPQRPPEGSNLHDGTAEAISEDCLYLNVWTPAAGTPVASPKRPVMVWIYGGLFRVGSAATGLFNGEPLARKGVVFVSFNYRVGPFGYLAHPDLARESDDQTSGNYALLDQIAALKWVHANIAAFGGDPDRVTVVGQSAGSMSISALMASPVAKGLFHRAIGESGAQFGPSDLRPRAQAEQAGMRFAAALGAHSIADLRAKTAEQILNGGWQSHGTVIDGWVHMKNASTAVFALVGVLAPASGFAQVQPCERLASLSLPNTTITSAQTVSAGAFTMPTIPGQAPAPAGAFGDLPAFCRVAATLRPSSDSDIKIEVWLPIAAWNGKFLGVGNGGWAGTIAYNIANRSLADGLRRGYAVASTDTGHTGTNGDGSFALDHLEKLTDFAYRAVHEMTAQAKSVIRAYYGAPPHWSYWNGCSTGGKQGLKEAQRYPDDYDGIVAGAPSNNWTHLQAAALAAFLATHKDQASFIPQAKYLLINGAVLNACDALDGVKDGVVEDPRRCTFDPAALTCQAGEASSCLTSAQVEAARSMYAQLRNPRTNADIYPGLERGSELGWVQYAGGDAPFNLSADHFRFVVFKNRNWDYRTLEFDRDVERADRIDNGTINATDPDLRPFFTRGGKLLLYHGWTDPLIAPRNTINYFNSVLAKLGRCAKAEESMRLFMVPGMNHCQGGTGATTFDAVAALEAWVERNQAPARIPAARVEEGAVTRTRPLCAFPHVAEYVGTGSPDRAENFACKTP